MKLIFNIVILFFVLVAEIAFANTSYFVGVTYKVINPQYDYKNVIIQSAYVEMNDISSSPSVYNSQVIATGDLLSGTVKGRAKIVDEAAFITFKYASGTTITFENREGDVIHISPMIFPRDCGTASTTNLKKIVVNIHDGETPIIKCDFVY